MRPYDRRADETSVRHRARALRVLALVAAAIITTKLFYLQATRSSYYRAKADEQHRGTIRLQAQRGDIQILSSSGERTALATDIALDLVFIDPAFIQLQAEDAIDDAPAGERAAAQRAEEEKQRQAAEFLADLLLPLPPLGTGEQLYRGVTYPDDAEEKRSAFIARIRELMTAKEVDHVTFLRQSQFTPELAKKIEELHLRGIFVTETEIYGDPTLIEDIQVVSRLLAPLVDLPMRDLEERLRRRPVRYVVLKRKVPPEVSKAIQNALAQKKLVGVGLSAEQWRFYPEGSLASNVVGFVNREGRGQYGIEESFDDAQRPVTLRGIDGYVRVDRDPSGRQIAVGDEVLEPERDGDDLVLTLDRVVQRKMEEILAEAVESAKGEKGALIVTEPYSGRIIAMASYPTFDPNHYEDVMERIPSGPQQGDFRNKVGPLAYVNVGSDIPYEPGSVFKVVTMSAGIDANEITPDTITYDRTGFIEVDNYIVRNSTLKAEGRMTMTNVLERSSNLGTAFVSQKLGRTLFHYYIERFGFGQRTDIELVTEHPGLLKEPQKWADIDLITASFGQGINASPVQMVAAVGAIANGGQLMRPTIIDRVIHATEPGEPEFIEHTEPQVVRQVIKPETAAQVAAMMVSVIDHGLAPKAKVPGYYVAGKTGTSQIAKERGAGYETGPGSTIATLAGFAPAANPKVVVYIRIDRPTADYWGSTIAAPSWSRAVQWLMGYYNVPAQR